MSFNQHRKIVLPPHISKYIREHFRENFLTETRVVHKQSGEKHFQIDVTHDGAVHHLRFNTYGDLLKSRIERIRVPEEEDNPFGDGDESGRQ